jgi:3-keto-disaccharide hydrolase
LKKEDNNNSNNNKNPFTILFDGKSLDGWKMAGKGKFTVMKDEKALLSDGGMGLLWYTKKRYNDFILRLEWRVLHKDDNSGVFVRFPDPGNDPQVAVNDGYEIQIDDLGKPDDDGIHKTGAIYNFAAPSKIVSKPVGQWNNLEIKVIKQNYIVIINHQKITEFIGNKSLNGYVGLQNHDAKSKVSFRNIRIEEII